jgi:hypothetical protein
LAVTSAQNKPEYILDIIVGLETIQSKRGIGWEKKKENIPFELFKL